jgi:hypothetical protein
VVAMSMSLFEAKSKFFVSSNIPANCPNSNQKLLIFKMKKKKKRRSQKSNIKIFLLDKKFNLKKYAVYKGSFKTHVLVNE